MNRYVSKIKRYARTGAAYRLKARLIVRGFEMEKEKDYDQNFSPTPGIAIASYCSHYDLNRRCKWFGTSFYWHGTGCSSGWQAAVIQKGLNRALCIAISLWAWSPSRISMSFQVREPFPAPLPSVADVLVKSPLPLFQWLSTRVQKLQVVSRCFLVRITLRYWIRSWYCLKNSRLAMHRVTLWVEELWIEITYMCWTCCVFSLDIW